MSEGASKLESTIKSNLGRLNTEWVAWQIEQIDPDFLGEGGQGQEGSSDRLHSSCLSITTHSTLTWTLSSLRRKKNTRRRRLYGFVMDTSIFDEWDDRRWVFDRERNTWRPHDTLRLTYHQDALAAIQDLDNTQSCGAVISFAAAAGKLG